MDHVDFSSTHLFDQIEYLKHHTFTAQNTHCLLNKYASYRQIIFRVIPFHIGGGNNRVAYDVVAQLFAGFHNNRFNYSARVQVRQVLYDQIAFVNID